MRRRARLFDHTSAESCDFYHSSELPVAPFRTDIGKWIGRVAEFT